MKKTLTLLLTLLLLCCFSTTALAYDYQYSLQASVERLDPVQDKEVIALAKHGNFDTIEAYTDTGLSDGNFAGLT